MKKFFSVVFAFCAAALFAAEEVWPDRQAMLNKLMEQVPHYKRTFRPETGEFGTKPWICNDQNVIFPLAVLWGTDMPGNKYFHDPQILDMIARGGCRLVDAQDAKGMWIFRKKDNSTWGMIHMPWTYTRWIRAYLIVRDALSPADRAKWEKGLQLGFRFIDRSLQGSTRVQNIPATRATALYCAGIAFGREDWKKHAVEYLYRVIAEQAPDGWWTEHYGPVVGYNFVYLDTLGVYYHYSQDPKALDALRRGAKFHASLLWQDGSSFSAIDERNPYSKGKRFGNVGFSHTPEGRFYLLRQARSGGPAADTAAHMLHEGGTGPGVSPFPADGCYLAQDRKYTVTRRAPYSWVFSAYTCKPSPSRWIMERQCHVEIAHDRYGVIAGGGNTRMQPYFSNFTFGDPDSIRPDYTTDKPDFFPKTDLRYLADSAVIDGDTLNLVYGENKASVTLKPDGEALDVCFRVSGPFARPVMAHLPLLRGTDLRTVDGKILPPSDRPVTGRELGGKLLFAPGLAVVLPDDAVIHPAVRGFHPYQKEGKGAHPRMVVSVPITKARPTARIRFEPCAEADEMALWGGDPAAVRTMPEKCPAAKIAVAGDALELTGRTTPDTNGYIFVKIPVTPTVVTGKTLCFELETAEVLRHDSIYVKGKTRSGKCVFAALKNLPPGKNFRRAFAVDLPQCKGFKTLADQVKAGPEEPVTCFEIHFGRGVRDSEMKIRLRDLKLKKTKKGSGK